MLHARLDSNIEAILQFRGESTSQVPSVDDSLVASGPHVTPVSSSIFDTEATREERLVMQRRSDCDRYQWGPEWICHHCLSENLTSRGKSKVGVICSYERVWHSVHPALKVQNLCPIVPVKLSEFDDARMLVNLIGDPRQEVTIGSSVEAVFEHHDDADHPFTLVHWKTTEA